jgi:chaperonin GroES
MANQPFPIKPLGDTVVLSPVLIQEETKGGVILPSTASLWNGTKRQREAEVLAVGPGKLLPDYTRSQMSVKVGDYVLFDASAGVEYTREEKVFCTLIPERSVVAVITRKESV